MSSTRKKGLEERREGEDSNRVFTEWMEQKKSWRNQMESEEAGKDPQSRARGTPRPNQLKGRFGVCNPSPQYCSTRMYSAFFAFDFFYSRVSLDD